MIMQGDCLEVLATIPENSIDTCITDPPYELGFMGKHWDSSGVAFQVATWEAVYRVLKPGAIMLAFGGTRTYHRMVCAIEDAGFEIRDTIAWVYGSGFPKSYDISKGIDKQAGAEREVVERRPHAPNAGAARFGQAECTEYIYSLPSTPEAQLWHGWGTALKPAFEPIVVAMKPIDGTFVDNALKCGVAGYWIDGARVGTEQTVSQEKRGRYGSWSTKVMREQGFRPYNIDNRYQPEKVNPPGRFPANFIHDGSDEVKELFPQSKGGVAVRHNSGGNTFGGNNPKPPMEDMSYNDSGSAARFFYCAKASRSERNAGLEGTNHHPTIKPIELMRYLVRLTKTPTGGVVLDPFMGSGTTGIACELEGREFIGIEREAEYVEIAEKRIAHYRLPILDEA